MSKLLALNKFMSIIVLILLCLVSTTYAQNESPEYETFYDTTTKQNVQVISSEITVKFKRGTPIEEIEKLNSQFNAEIIKQIKILGIYKIKISTSIPVDQVIEQYKTNPNVLLSEPDYVGRTFSVSTYIPNLPKTV
ncbi:MAG: hypothetical protein ABIJ11_06030 [Elusimicrobiota bacterium]